MCVYVKQREREREREREGGAHLSQTGQLRDTILTGASLKSAHTNSVGYHAFSKQVKSVENNLDIKSGILYNFGADFRVDSSRAFPSGPSTSRISRKTPIIFHFVSMIDRTDAFELYMFPYS